MSIIDRIGVKALPDGSAKDPIYTTLRNEYLQVDGITDRNRQLRAMNLAMFYLRVCAGWSSDMIGLAFDRHKRHVLKCIHKAREDVQDQFDVNLAEQDQAKPDGEPAYRIHLHRKRPTKLEYVRSVECWSVWDVLQEIAEAARQDYRFFTIENLHRDRDDETVPLR